MRTVNPNKTIWEFTEIRQNIKQFVLMVIWLQTLQCLHI